MKNLLLISLSLSIFSNSLPGQLYKNDVLTFKYEQQPLQPLPEKFSSYHFIVNPGGADFKYIRYPKIYAWYETEVLGNVNSNYGSVPLAQQEFMNLTEYEKDSINPDFIIETTFEDLRITGKTVFRHEYCSGVSAPCYAYILTYTFGASLKVTTSEGEVLIDTVYSDHHSIQKGWFGKKDFKTAKANNAEQVFREAKGGVFAYTTRGELAARFQQNELFFVGQLIREALLDMEELIVNQYDYPLKESRMRMAYDRSTRKLNYDDINQALDNFREGVQLFNESYEEQSWKPIFRESIKTWENALKEVDMNDRRARIHKNLAPALCGNIAISAMWLRDWKKFDEAIDRGLTLTPDNRSLLNLREFGYSIKGRY